jgi:LysM repeat protein
MAGRSPARFLAPLALAAFVVALLVVVTSSRNAGEGESPAPNQATETRPASQEEQPDEAAGEEEAEEEREPRRYTVQPGDTPSSIAEETGVPLEDILRLNPNLDPQTLSPGTRLRLRQ